MIALIPMLFLITAYGEEPKASLEHKLDYVIDQKFLEEGNFQYFYSLLQLPNIKEPKKFKNLYEEQSETPVGDILKVFMPLDTKKLWNPEDKNYLAVAKVSYLLPTSLKKIDEAEFTDTDYLQRTLPQYKVTKHKDYFHVGGSFITPDFRVKLNFLKPDHPAVAEIFVIDQEKLKAGKIKVTLMHQDKFGKVLFFKTAKASTALIIYEGTGPEQTLVTQYILSNVINVPSKELIRKGMIENLQNVVKGSRSWVQKRL